MAILARFPANKRALAALKTLPAQRPEHRGASSGAASAGAQLNELIALVNQGQLQKVLEHGAALARQFPGNPLIPNILGAAYAASERFEDAIASFSRALEIDPGIFLAHSNMGAALAALGRHDEAVAWYTEALRLKPDYAVAHNNLGNALKALGRHGEAVVSYARALEIRPDFAEAHGSLGVTLRDMGRFEDAIEHLSRALQLKPGDAELHNSLGVALNSLGRHDAAIASYREALRVKPDLSEAFSNLCELLEKTHRIDDLRRTVSQARAAFDGDDPQLHYWLAEIASREGRHPDARDHLEAIAPHRLPLKTRLQRSSLLGRTYDRLDQFDLSFSQFAETNRLAVEWQSFRDYDATRYVAEVLELKNSWAQASPIDWATGGLARSDIPLAFMVGFPRSGTTLLDTVLRSHPRIVVAEEMPLIERVKIELGGPPTFATLDALGADSILRLRAVYFDALRQHLGDQPGDRLVVDKLPLNLINAGLIHRIFPEAKFILALRHPCDCVLSCFMQNFRLNDAMANFLDLEQSARLYDLAMTLWQQYRQKLRLDVGYLKYEDLVMDLRSAVEPLLGFLGLQWDDNLLNYQATALSRGRINTPSYNQVTRKLYPQASGRWRNYRAHMAAVLPILAPWSAEWGYAA
jgi:tetratricopeptide (TPR) repeat protein